MGEREPPSLLKTVGGGEGQWKDLGPRVPSPLKLGP